MTMLDAVTLPPEKVILQLIWEPSSAPLKRSAQTLPGSIKLDFSYSKDVVVGRHSRSEVVIPSLSVSRRHAALFLVEENLFICDLNSTNGTFLNGTKLEVGREYLIRPGDLLQVGSVPIKPLFKVDKKENSEEILANNEFLTGQIIQNPSVKPKKLTGVIQKSILLPIAALSGLVISLAISLSVFSINQLANWLEKFAAQPDRAAFITLSLLGLLILRQLLKEWRGQFAKTLTLLITLSAIPMLILFSLVIFLKFVNLHS